MIHRFGAETLSNVVITKKLYLATLYYYFHKEYLVNKYQWVSLAVVSLSIALIVLDSV